MPRIDESILDDDIFSIRDIIDSQLETCDGVRIGRVADIEIEQHADGTLHLSALLIGPQALAARLSPKLRSLARWLFRDRFDHRITLDDVESFGPTLRLRRRAEDYPIGQSERWIAKYLLRWLPGSGY
jgi:hypothetical protein